jgi:hypothetical protein
MNSAVFISQLDEFYRKARLYFLGGGTLVFAFNLLVICYIFNKYPLREHAHAALSWYLAGLLITSGSIVIFYMALRRFTKRHAPICQHCGATPMWQDRLQIQNTGCCQKCGARVAPGNA